MITEQLLLSETLARALAAEDGFDITLLHPHDSRVVERCREARADVLVMDIDLRDGTGMKLLSRLVEEMPSGRVLVFTGRDDVRLAAESVERGARGYLTFAASVADVRDAIRDVAAGRMVLPGLRLGELVREQQRDEHWLRPAPHPLTERELDVLRRLTRGQPTAGIAAEMGISVNTVRTHIQNILNKLGVHSKIEAAAYAVRNGLV